MAPPPTHEDELEELGADDEMVVYRIVREPDPGSPAYADSFRSHAELGLPPRGPEQSHPLVYEGISVFESREAAVETARKFPVIGSYVAELLVAAETGARFFRWGANGHLTLWGDPLKLAGATVDTIPV